MKTTWWLPLGLGLLAAPRAVLHDRGLVEPRTGLNAALVAVPLIIWIVVARGPRPFPLLLRAGLVYGVCLAMIHNWWWDGESVLLRTAMSLSSLATGLVAGAVCGAVARLLSPGRRRSVGQQGDGRVQLPADHGGPPQSR